MADNSNRITAYYERAAASLLERETKLLAEIQRKKSGRIAAKLELAEIMLDLSSCYIVMHNLLLFSRGRGNEELLNKARRAVSKSFSWLESIVTNNVDVPFSDLDSAAAALEGVSAEERYRLIRKMGLALSLMEYAWGENSKWKWNFVDMEGKLAALSRNILDLRNLGANLDMRAQDYETTKLHLRMVKKLFNQAANRYREKYELFPSHLSADFVSGIDFLTALRRLHAVLGEQDEANEVKKTLDAWSEKLARDMRTRGRKS